MSYDIVLVPLLLTLNKFHKLFSLVIPLLTFTNSVYDKKRAVQCFDILGYYFTYYTLLGQCVNISCKFRYDAPIWVFVLNLCCQISSLSNLKGTSHFLSSSICRNSKFIISGVTASKPRQVQFRDFLSTYIQRELLTNNRYSQGRLVYVLGITVIINFLQLLRKCSSFRVYFLFRDW